MPTPTSTSTLITRDEILAQAGSGTFTLEYGNGARARILCTDGDAGYAQTLRTGALLRFTRTDRRARVPMVAVNVATATDTGDQAGTLSFTDDGTLRGLVNSGVFGEQAR